MLKEVLVLHGNDSVYQRLRNVAISHQPPLLALVGKARDELRLEVEDLAFRVVLQRNDTSELPICEFQYTGFTAGVRIPTRKNLHRSRAYVVPTDCIPTRRGVSGSPQPRQHIVDIQRIAHGDGARSTKDIDAAGERSGRQAGVDAGHELQRK